MKVSCPVKEITCTQAAFAQAVGLTRQRIGQLIDLDIVVKDEKDLSGGVLLFQSLKNFFLNKQAKAEDANLFKEKALHEKVKRQIAEIKLAKEEGSVYDAKTVESVMTEQLAGLRTHLLSLGIKLGAVLEGKKRGEIADIINKEVEERLAELSEYKPELFTQEVPDVEAKEEKRNGKNGAVRGESAPDKKGKGDVAIPVG